MACDQGLAQLLRDALADDTRMTQVMALAPEFVASMPAK